jgi:Tol biopolymer transport system component
VRDILFSEGRTPLYMVSTVGGNPTPVTSLDVSRQEVSHRWPQWLPDDEHFLYFIESGNPEYSGTYIGSRDGQVKARLLDSPALHAPGYLVFVRNRVLYAQRFDDRRYQLTGGPVALAADVAPPQATTNAIISVSREGTLAYGGAPTTERFIWFDRSGREIGSVNTPAGLYNPRLTADHSALLAASGAEGGRRGIWLIDLERGEQTRLTEGMRPLSSPDAARVVFTTDRATGVSDIYTRAVRGDRDEILVQSAENKVSNDWSRDGRFFVFASLSQQTKWDLWTLPMDEARTPRPFLQTPFNESQAQLSPSGQWIAYNSDETGRFEVYLQSFPDGGNKRAVSVGGGTEPQWRDDERELFYVGPEGAVMSVDVVPGSPLRLGTPTLLFRAPLARSGMNLAHYDVSPDGQRILVHAESSGEGRPLMQMLINWPAAVPR